MKKSGLALITLAGMLVLCSCQNNNRVLPSAEAIASQEETSKAVATENIAENIEATENIEETAKTELECIYPIAEDALDKTENMALYKEYPFSYADIEWKLQKYVQEDMLIDGELALDDRAHFLMQLVSANATYVLFDDTVQIGEPSADVWTDIEDKLHITVKDVRTASYKIYDYTYNNSGASGEEAFIVKTLIAADAINYLGGLD